MGEKMAEIICEYCGNDTFKVSCGVVIDSAELTCTKCKKMWMG